MSASLVESLIGALVLLVAGWFVFYGYQQTEGRTAGGYELQARFDRVNGLTIGSDVRLSGIKVGTVVDQRIDPETFQAVVRFTVRSDVALPTDTAAAISAEGLLGGGYLSLLPGGMEETLIEGDEIEETQDAIDLVGLLGRFMFNDDGTDDGGKKPADATTP